MPLEGRDETFRDRSYRAVSDKVTVPVVEQFEIVDVDEKQADPVVPILGGCDREVQLRV